MECFMVILVLVLGTINATFGLDCSQSPNNVDPDTCCKTEMLISIDVITECLTKYGEQTKRQATLPGPKRGCCIGDCITNKLGVNPNGDGNLDRPGLENLLKGALKDSSFKDSLDAGIKKCFEMIDSKKTEFDEAFALQPSFEGEKICHPISGQVLSCIHNEMFINCPANIWQENADCAVVKNYVKECQIIPRHGA